MPRFLRTLLGALLGVLVCTGHAMADGSPEAFTRYALSRARAALPNHRVDAPQPLVLRAMLPDGGSFTLNLAPTYEGCLRSPPDCAAFLNRRLATMAEFGRPRPAVERSALRAVVRDWAYVEELQTRGRLVGQELFTGRPLAGDLWVLAVFDTPQSIGMLTDAHRTQLGVGVDEAIEIGRRNIAATLPPIEHVLPSLRAHAVRQLPGDYEPSRILLHAQWAALAQQTEGGLVVAMPGRNLLLVGRGNDASTVHRAAHRALRDAVSPMTATVLRWTRTGWVPL